MKTHDIQYCVTQRPAFVEILLLTSQDVITHRTIRFQLSSIESENRVGTHTKITATVLSPRPISFN